MHKTHIDMGGSPEVQAEEYSLALLLALLALLNLALRLGETTLLDLAQPFTFH